MKGFVWRVSFVVITGEELPEEKYVNLRAENLTDVLFAAQRAIQEAFPDRKFYIHEIRTKISMGTDVLGEVYDDIYGLDDEELAYVKKLLE